MHFWHGGYAPPPENPEDQIFEGPFLNKFFTFKGQFFKKFAPSAHNILIGVPIVLSS